MASRTTEALYLLGQTRPNTVRRLRDECIRDVYQADCEHLLMRIGIVGPVYPDSFADNLISALAVMGHEPIPLGAALPSPTSRWASKAMMTLARSLAVAEHWQRRLVRTAQEQNLDLTISVHA